MDEAILYEYDTSSTKEAVVEENKSYVEEILLILALLLLLKKITPSEMNDYMARVQDASLRSLTRIQQRLMQDLPLIAKHGVLAGQISTGRIAVPLSTEEALKLANSIRLSDDHYDVLDNLFDKAISNLRLSHDGLSKRFEQEMKAAVVRHLREKMATESRPSSDTTTAFVDRNGRRWSIERYTNMLMNGLMREVFQESLTQYAIEGGFRFGQVSSNPTTIDKCVGWQGKIVKFLDSDPAPIPSINDMYASGEIFHPNCVHFVVPLAIDEKTAISL